MNKEKLRRQLELEEESISLGVKRYREQIATTPISEMAPGLALMYRAIEPLSKAIDDFVNTPKRGGARMHQARDFLKNIDPYEVAYITAKELMNHIATPRQIQIASRNLFDTLATHIEYQKMLKEHPNYLDVVERRLNKSNSGAQHRRSTLMYAKRHGLGIEDTSWEDIDKVHVGVKFIDLFIEHTGLVERFQTETSQWILQGTAEALEWINSQNARCELLSPVFLPMIVKPVPWETVYGGGYLGNYDTMRIKMVKTRNKGALGKSTLFRTFLKRHQLKIALGTGSTILTG